MADIQIVAEVVGQKKINSLIKSTQTLEGRVKTLSKAYQSGKIGPEQYQQGLTELRKAASKLYPTHQKASAVITKLSKDYLAASKAQKEYTAAQKQEQAATKAYIQARREATEANRRYDAQQRKAAQAAKQAADEEKRLKTQFDSNYRASQVYKRELRDLVKAKTQGIIATDRYQQEVQQLKTEFRDFGAQAKGVTALNNRFAAQTQMAGRRTNQLGVLMQQTGYQVGDFAVQVQSGTNVMVALGQQATQLVGTFGMLAKSTKMIGIFAGLGIAIPILTAVAGAFMRMREEADKSSKSAEEFEDKLKSARQEVKGMAEDLELVRRGFENAFEKTLTDQVEQAEEKLRLAREALREVEQRGPTAADQTGEGVRKAAEAVRLQQEAVALANTELQSARELVRQKKEQERSESITKQLAEARVIIKKQEKELQEEIAQGFANAVGPAKTVRNETEKHISKMAELFKNAQSMREELGDAAFEALRLSNVDMASGIDAATAAAAKLASQLGISVQRAIAIRNMSVVEAVGSTMKGGLGGPSGPAGQLPQNPNEIRNLPDFSTDAPVFGTGKSGGSGGGGGSAIDERQKMIDSVNRLISSYDEEYAKALKVEEATRLIAEAQRMGAIPANMEADQVLQDYIKSLEDAKDPMADFVNNFAKQMSSAFMSIVDGSKSASDAFRDMARAILKQAFEMAVINPIINSIFGGVGGFTKLPSFFANGAAFSNGKVTAYANGGVVNQPTGFQHSGGLGVMGEAGPEAIMPLKRGKNGKLGVQVEGGSQQPVVINQSFNFSANGDESVKRIIAQEAPKIANLTQKQILDQRRRGGVMKSTFG